MPIDSVSAFQGGTGGSYYVPTPPPPQKKKKIPFPQDSLESLADPNDPSLKTSETEEAKQIPLLLFLQHFLKKRFRFLLSISNGLKGLFLKMKMKKPAKSKEAGWVSKVKAKTTRVIKKGAQGLSTLSSLLILTLKNWGLKIYRRWTPPYVQMKEAVKARLRVAQAFVKRNFDRIKQPILKGIEKIGVQLGRASLFAKRQGEKIKKEIEKRWKAISTPIREWVDHTAIPKVRIFFEGIQRFATVQAQHIKTFSQSIYQSTVAFFAPMVHRLQAWGKWGLSRVGDSLGRFQKKCAKWARWAREKSQKLIDFAIRLFGPPIERVVGLLLKAIENFIRYLLQFLQRNFFVFAKWAMQFFRKNVKSFWRWIKTIPGRLKSFVFQLGFFLKAIPFRILKALKWIDITLYRLFRRVTFNDSPR